MFGFEDISIDLLTGSPWACWGALIVLLALGIFLYYRTNPPLPRYLRTVLAALRLIAVLALAGALLEPVVSYSRTYERPPRVSVLIDASESMSRVESGTSRADRIDSLLGTSAFTALENKIDLSVHYFANDLAETRELVQSDKTALGDVLYEQSKREMAVPSDLWLLLSDGRSNSGRDPVTTANGLTTPVTTVGIAADVSDFDVSLATVDYSTIAFVGRPVEILARLEWHNAEGKTISVELRDGSRVVTQQELTIDQETGLADIPLRYAPSEPGQKLLRVEIPALDQEKTAGNNSRTISLKVLKSQIAVLMISQGPDYELGFLRRYFGKSDRYEIDLRVLGNKAGNLSGRFPDRQTELNRFDLVILHDIDPHALDGRQGIINSYLSEKGGAVWVMMGERFASRGPVDWFNQLLPFHQSRRKTVDYREFHGEPSESELFHPLVRLDDNRTGIREAWASLPPFKSLVTCDLAHPEGVILVYAGVPSRGGYRIPAAGYRRFGPGKLMATAALPFWFWGYVNLGFGEDDAYYSKFLEGTSSWLTVHEDFDPVRVTPISDVFNRGEQVTFEGVAFDQGFRPIPGVHGTVRLSAEEGSESFEADLIQQTEGRYRAEFRQLPPGQYRYVGAIEKEGELLKENTGLIQVEAFSLEEYDQSGNPAVLRAVAGLTGGEHFDYDEFDLAVGSFNLDPVKVSVAGESSIWNNWWLLVVFVVSLATEWAIRKLNHLL